MIDGITEVFGLDGKRMRPCARPKLTPPPKVERPYAPRAQVKALWSACVLPSQGRETDGLLRRRGFDLPHVDATKRARVIPKDAQVPRWARYRGRSPSSHWRHTSHTICDYDRGC